ncbi:MAG: hypothetical protein Kow0029_09370 [Candidatus Rifleibacteriota bacterium]
MKLQLYPEDILIEYVERLLLGEEDPAIRMARFIPELPGQIEFSEEFALRWRNLVEPTVKKFISDSFLLHQFVFEYEGSIRKLCVTDPDFWAGIDLSFSQRSAQRLYEYMKSKKGGEEPLYPITTPADAIFISIVTGDFDLFSYAWLAKNRANWAVFALFITWQPVLAGKVPWKWCFDNPKEIPLPVRVYLLERCAVYFSCLNHLVRSGINNEIAYDSDFDRLSAERSGSAVPLNFVPDKNIGNAVGCARALATSLNKAMEYWTGEGTVALDDERYLRGAYSSAGLAEELNDFAAVVKEYTETVRLKEAINESVIFN